MAGMTKRKKEKTKSRTLEYPVASKVRDLSYLKSVIQNNTFILTSIKLLVKGNLLKDNSIVNCRDGHCRDGT